MLFPHYYCDIIAHWPHEVVLRGDFRAAIATTFQQCMHTLPSDDLWRQAMNWAVYQAVSEEAEHCDLMGEHSFRTRLIPLARIKAALERSLNAEGNPAPEAIFQLALV